MTDSNLSKLPNFPQDDEGPIFPTPWAARAFAMTTSLCESGQLNWSEWVATFSAELAHSAHGAHALAGDVRDYYECWVDALERLLARKRIVSEDALESSFRSTIASWPDPDHVARREPIAKSPRL